jgi:hypothetical protein
MVANILLVVAILITSHTLSVEGSTWVWRRVRKLEVLIIVNPWIFSKWIIVNMCGSCCSIRVSCHIQVQMRQLTRMWQPSVQGLDSVSHSRNTTLHPLKCCFSGRFGLVEHLIHGRSSLVERLIHGRSSLVDRLHHVHHLFELLGGNQDVILFLYVLQRWLFPGRHG